MPEEGSLVRDATGDVRALGTQLGSVLPGLACWNGLGEG